MLLANMFCVIAFAAVGSFFVWYSIAFALYQYDIRSWNHDSILETIVGLSFGGICFYISYRAIINLLQYIPQ